MRVTIITVYLNPAVENFCFIIFSKIVYQFGYSQVTV